MTALSIVVVVDHRRAPVVEVGEVAAGLKVVVTGGECEAPVREAPGDVPLPRFLGAAHHADGKPGGPGIGPGTGRG